MEQHFVKLKLEDRIDLFVELQLNIISSKELKSYLLKSSHNDYQNILSTSVDEDAIVYILEDNNCNTEIGINNSLDWLNCYLGDEPDNYNERVKWANRRKRIIDKISHTKNEYLKVLTWAKYFQSSGKMALLKDVFYLYPTDLQIRIVKKLFCAMSTKKFTASLEKIAKTIGYGNHKLSLPIEMVLKYLFLKEKDNSAHMTDEIMLKIFQGRVEYDDWFKINQMLNPCNGRMYFSNDDHGTSDAYRNFNGVIKKWTVNGQEVFRFLLSRRQITFKEGTTQYNNKLYETIKEYISIVFTANDFKFYEYREDIVYDFCKEKERELRIMAEAYRIKMEDVDYDYSYELDENEERFCCECRVSDRLENNTNKVFLWCRNRPCFCNPPRFHASYEWENYTVLDFMRILSIPTDYYNQKGGIIRYGQYIIFSTYMLSFHEFLEHLKCRECEKLMEPRDLTNFTRYSITEFECKNTDCRLYGHVVYLNKCFNPKCNNIIDSRDSKQCPNNSYICERCGACCSTKKYSERLNRLIKTGGYISNWLQDAIHNNIGHLEKNELYCSSCGRKINSNTCTCGKEYKYRISSHNNWL